MRGKRLQHQITMGRFTLPIVIFSCILCSGLINILFFPIPSPEITYPLWNNLHASIPAWSTTVVNFLLYAAGGYFLIEINNRFNIIGTRASIQSSLYFLFITAVPWIYPLNTGSVISVCLLFAIFFLFRSYHEIHPSTDLFHSSVYIGLGSLVFPQLTFLMPFWWLSAYHFKSLNPRSFCASLVGWSFPYWFLFGYTYFTGHLELFYQPFVELGTFHRIHVLAGLPLWKYLILGYLFLLFFVSSIHCAVGSYHDKIRTRTLLTFVIWLGFLFFLLCLLQPEHIEDLLPPLIVVVSIMAAHFFALTNSRASNLFFIFSMIAWVALFGYNIWTLLLNR